MPRKVPRSRLRELLICTKWVSSPASPNSRSQKNRAKKPRSSARSSSSITKAPASGVGTKRMMPSRRGGFGCAGQRQPIEAVAQGAQPDELVAVKIGSREAMIVKLRQQPLHARRQRVFEPEIRQQPGELAEGDAVIARILANLSGVDDRRARHEVPHDIGDVAHLIIFCIAADVDRLIVDRRARRFKKGDEGAGDVLAVNERPPWRAITHDADVALGDGATQEG